QAEDGIRDRNVTGVQTCALPIWDCSWARPLAPASVSAPPASSTETETGTAMATAATATATAATAAAGVTGATAAGTSEAGTSDQIGRASCRGGGGRWAGARPGDE